MKQKISLQQLLDEDLLEIPEPDLEFTLGDLIGRDHAGLKGKKGFYYFKKGNKVLYVGVSNQLGTRLYNHRMSSVKNGSFSSKLLSKGYSIEEFEKFISKVTVCVTLESSPASQDVYEKYLILKHNPEFNYDSKEGGRGSIGWSAERLTVLYGKVETLFKNGMSYSAISRELSVDRHVIAKCLNNGSQQTSATATK